MPYTINKYNGSVIASVADGTIDNTTDIKLIGKNYAGYGEVQNENFLFLLENFSNTTQPPRPIAGQIWYDSGTSKLKFYDGSKFRTTGGAEVGTSAPTGLTQGDFWWDSANKQLYAWDGATYILVGPQGVAGSQTTQMRSRPVKDTLQNVHAIIEAVVDGDTIFIISPDAEFTLDPIQNAITGFTKIHQGVTLAYTNDDSNPGETSSNHRFWGTSTNADRLGGTPASDFALKGQATFTNIVQFADAGYTVGEVPKLKVFNSSNTTPTIQNLFNDTIVFQTYSGGDFLTPLKLVGSNLIPGVDNASDIGSTTFRFKTVNAVTFQGTATSSDSLKVSGESRTGSSAASSGTVAVRTNALEVINGVSITAGALKATYFVGTATAANYADLAEMYLADFNYDVGTVLMIGGEKEVTACEAGHRAIGPVSASPAYLMNKDLPGGTIIALKGRVPVKVVGAVEKGQRLVAGPNGTAQATNEASSDVFAIALESNSEDGIRLVECLII